MQVILLDRIAKLGKLGEVVRVRDGYARNFLIPKGLAKRATQKAIADFDKQKVELEQKASDKLKKETSQKAKEIKSKTAKKIEEGKKKLKKFNLKDKLNKFKNSKSHKEFSEK